MIEGLTCEQHPGAKVIGTCARCGVFICEVDKTLVGARSYCPACAARPEVSWLDQLRTRWLGVRDAWCWTFLGLAVLEFVAFVAFGSDLVRELTAGRWSPANLIPERVPALTLLATMTALHAVYLLGKKWIRWGIGAVPVLGGVLAIAQDQLGVAVYWFLMFLFAATSWTDTRNKLFFRLHTPDAELKRYHERNLDNPPAQWGSKLAAIGLFIPFLGVAAVVLGAVGFAKVDDTATPPIGKRGLAVFAMAVGLLETALYAFVFFR